MNYYYPAPTYPMGPLAPQGFFGGLLGSLAGGPLGGALGGLFGNSDLGSQIGRVVGGIGGGLLPFGVDPVATMYGNAALSPMSILLPQTNDPETQALNDFLQHASAAVIQQLSGYLEANAQPNPQLSAAVPLVERAAELYGSRDYGRAFTQAYQAYRSIATLRAQSPNLPGY